MQRWARADGWPKHGRRGSRLFELGVLEDRERAKRPNVADRIYVQALAPGGRIEYNDLSRPIYPIQDHGKLSPGISGEQLLLCSRHIVRITVTGGQLYLCLPKRRSIIYIFVPDGTLPV
jgi:hypothetical protein